MEVLGIIQARGGSKSIPKKNIKLLAGKPLITWTIEEAKKARSITKLIVSTDDREIAEVCQEFGAEAPFLRPKEYATDQAKSIGVLRHALEWLGANQNYYPDVVVQLKPTNPLRRAEHIDDCVKLFLASPEIDAVITVTKSPAHPLKCWKFKDEFLEPFVPEEAYGIKEAAKMPRQMLPEAYVNNSCVHVINPATILKKSSSIGTKVKGVILNREDSINIDDELDFKIAELLIKEKHEN